MKTAIILFNLGGPDTLDNVKPFLFNLFKDKAILGLPAFIRYPLAALISSRREAEAKHIYAAIGGGSPLLPNTLAQANALEKNLNTSSVASFKVFTVMRYWHPMADAVVKDVQAFAPDKIIYLPLYPQFSTTTTQSSFDEFDRVLRVEGREPKSNVGSRICCYPTLSGLINAYAKLIKPVYEQVEKEAGKSPRILFSAHGLPEKVIKSGDPYQYQIMETTKAVVAALNISNLDYVNCFQSRVGPLKWIAPYTDAEIERAGTDGVPILIVPIAFVSEHSETLYEIEQQYRELAAQKGVPVFARVPAVSTHPDFIDGLASLVHEALGREIVERETSCAPCGGTRVCSEKYVKCPCKTPIF
jgi:protoporphyrin/coproporphyrin ferrochelatase